MKTKAICVVVLVIGVLLAWMSGTCRAESITLSLSSDDDLTNVPVGQTVTIKVEMFGLEFDEELEYLAAIVTFDGAILGTPLSITPHATPDGILPDLDPDPLWPAWPPFVSGAFPGSADGSYDSFFSSTLLPIEDNGLFYSFDVTAQALGTTELTLDFPDALGPFGGLVTITLGDPLTLTATPEPTEVVGLVSLLLTGLAVASVRRRRHWRVRSED